MILDKKKILSSLALAGILTAGVLGANVNAHTANEYLKPVGVYKKLVEGKTVVPYVLKDKNTPVTVSDIQAEFTNLELVNGTAVTDINASVKTGDTFRANGIEYTVIVYGDVNRDGKASTKDALLIQKAVVGKVDDLDDFQTEAADINCDGKVSTKDALALQKYIVGKRDNLMDELPPIEDVTGPVLSGLNGDRIYIKLNDSEFQLPEVTATDDYDGNVDVVITGDVNITEEGDYQVVYTATDRTGNSATATLIVTVDGTAPVLKGVPTDTKYINVNDSTYTLPVVTAEDAVDGNVEVITEGTVDETTEGEYDITYTATDRAGNSATATFKVVVDGNGPVLSGVTDGEKVYIKLNDTEYTLPVVTAEDKVDGDVEVITEGTLDKTTEGEYKVTYSAKDSMENETKAILTVIVDGEAPTVDVRYSTQEQTKDGVTVTIISDEKIQDLEGWTLSEDGMSITKLYTENVEDEKLMVKDLAGNETETHIRISNIDTKVNAEVSYDVTIPTNGSVVVTITSDEEMQEVEGWNLAADKMSMTKAYDRNVIEDVVVKDVLGNEVVKNINIQNIDKTKPTAEVQFDVTVMTNGNVNVTLVANEKLQSATGTNIWTVDTEDNTKASAIFTANGTDDVTITDLAGNSSTVFVNVTNIDKDAPVLTAEYNITVSTNKNVIATIKSNEALQSVEGWNLAEDKKSITREYEANVSEDITVKDLVGNEQAITITITNIDKEAPIVGGFTEGKSSYKTVTPTFNETIATIQKDGEEAQAYTSGTEISADGDYVLVVTDAAGNTTTVEFTIDNVAPVFDTLEDVTLKNGDVFDTKVVAKDSVDGDIEVVPVITFNGSEVEAIDTTGENDGEYTLTYTATDEAGNTATTTRRVIVDATTATLVSMQSSNPDATTEVTIRVEFNEKMQLLDGWIAESDAQLAFTKKYTENANETVEFKDIAGNTTSVNISINNIDSDAPSAAVSYSTTEPTQGNVMATITAGEELKEVTGWTLSEDKKSMTKEYTDNTVTDEVVTISDLAGNTADVTVKVNNIDRVAPTGTVTYSETENTKNNVVATISADEKLKEVAGWTLSEDKKSMTKEYTDNTVADEVVTISDLAGNTVDVTVTVNNIDRNAPEIAGLTEGVSSYKTLDLTFTDMTGPITVTLQKGTEAAVIEELASGGTKTINAEGAYKLIAKDALGNEVTILFNIDQNATNITGVENGKRYLKATPVFADGVAVLNKLDSDNTTVLSTNPYTSGTEITEDGNYELVVTDAALNEERVKFVIDTKAPEVTNITNNETYTTAITPVVNEAGTIEVIKLVKDGEEVTDYTAIAEIAGDGVYELTLIDDLENSATVKFTIDTTGPQVTGVENGKVYKKVVPVFTEGTATLQKAGEEAESFVSGTEILADGEYTLVVTDSYGNTTTITFTVDNVGPVVTGVEEKTYKSGETVIPASTDLDIASVELVKDGAKVEGYTTLGEVTTGDGVYTLTVTDNAGNSTVVNFTIDTVVKNPEVITSNKGKATNENVIVTITAKEELQEVTGWTLSEDKMSMTKVYEDNTAVDGEDIVVSDIIGNTETVKVVVTGIDKVKPTAEVPEYSTTDATNQSVTVTIVANEKIQPVDGWELADDQVTLTKVFEDNMAETVTIADLAGNTIETPIEVEVNNIYNGLPTITGMFTSEEQNVAVSLTDTIKLPTVTAKDVKGADVEVTTTIIQVVNGVEEEYTNTELVLSAPTKYIITYTATDVAGNEATVQRIINVVAE